MLWWPHFLNNLIKKVSRLALIFFSKKPYVNSLINFGNNFFYPIHGLTFASHF